MGIYNASEKTELLRKIAEAGTYSTVSKKEKDIVENELYRQGLVDVFSYIGETTAVCGITDEGRKFLHDDIYVKQEQEELERKESEAIARENIKLTNKKLKYDIRTRYIAVISLIVSMASLMFNLCFRSSTSENPSEHPCDSLSAIAGSQRQCDTAAVFPDDTLRKVHCQCSRNSGLKDSLQCEPMQNR